MKPISLTNFLNYKAISQLNVSPSGTMSSFMINTADCDSNSYFHNIYILSDKGLSALTTSNDIADYIWFDESTIIYSSSETPEDSEIVGDQTHFYKINVIDGSVSPAFSLPVKTAGFKKINNSKFLITAKCDAAYPDYYRMTRDERSLVENKRNENKDYEVMDELPFWANGSGFTSKQRKNLFIYDNDSKTLTALNDPYFDLTAAAISDKYIVFAGETFKTKLVRRGEFYCYEIATGKCSPINTEMKYFVQNLAACGSRFMIVGSEYKRYGIEENYCFYEIDPITGSISLVADEDIYINNSMTCDCRYGSSTSIRGHEDGLYFITTQRKTTELYHVDFSGKITKIITREGSVDDFDIYNDRIVLTGLYDMKLQEIYEYSITTSIMSQLTRINEDVLKDCYVAEPELLLFKKHNVEMDGWILKPINYDPNKTYPAILDIHGGPRGIYGPTFFHEMQVWASAGFFVFFCNPEGSSGCGNEFGDLRGKYGTIDYDDIMEFTDRVLEKYPQIDTKRVGVTGGSYGGFMVNWIIGHTKRFAAAVSQRSISNWISFVNYSDIGTYFGVDQQASNIYTGFDKLWWHSPLKYTNNAVTPTLFIHSDEDYRCGMPEGIQMYTALMNQGVECRFCYFRGENHELSRAGKPLHRVKRLTEMTKWLTDHTNN